MPTTLFIADLHLDPKQAAISDLFFKFLQQDNVIAADALYILGDLFEAWLGDDDDTPLYQQVKTALKQATDAGLAIYLIHGNRDFLVADDFCQQTGCTLLDETVCIDLYGETTVLMHGDVLCTQDVAYLQMRQQIRHPAWQQQFLQLPLTQRRLAAQQLRQQSQQATAEKKEVIMDVTPSAVDAVLLDHQATCLIHGHTHRQAQHELRIAGNNAQRWVLGDWESGANVLVCRPDNKEFQTIR